MSDARVQLRRHLDALRAAGIEFVPNRPLAFAPAAYAKGGIKVDKKGVKIKGKKGGMKIDKKGLDIH